MANLKELETLLELKEKGVISEKEYDMQKKMLLGETSVQSNVNTFSHAGIMEVYIDFWKKSFFWRGRANRPEYWWPFLINGIIEELLIAIVDEFKGKTIVLVRYLPLVIFFLPSLAVTVRRFHDLGKSAFFAVVPLLITILYLVIALFSVLSLIGGDRPDNKLEVFIIVLGGIFVASIRLIWFGFTCLKGQESANKYGVPR